jgi:hypothetical protein
MSYFTTRRPYDHDHTPPQISNRLETLLVVVEPIVWDIDVMSSKDQFSVTEVHTAIPQRRLSLFGIESDLRHIYVPPLNVVSTAHHASARPHDVLHAIVV